MTSLFESKIEEYNKLLEQPEDPNAGAPMPPPDPAAGGDMGGDPAVDGAEGDMPEEEVDVEEAIDEIYKASKRPWVELASILAKAMKKAFSEEEVNDINNELSEYASVTVDDLIDRVNGVSGEYATDGIGGDDQSVKVAAMRLFGIVKKNMDIREKDPTLDVTRAENM